MFNFFAITNIQYYSIHKCISKIKKIFYCNINKLIGNRFCEVDFYLNY